MNMRVQSAGGYHLGTWLAPNRCGPRLAPKIAIAVATELAGLVPGTPACVEREPLDLGGA